MPTIEERIREIEEEINKTSYNKATEHHIGILKAKLARLQIESESRKKGGGTGFSIPKTGDATVALVGYPNVGKSSLLNRLTNAASDIGNFAFTTLTVIPGTLNYRGARIQILDLPGIIENAASGSGRGREVLSVVRSADMILVVTDPGMNGLEKLKEELYFSGIAISRKRKNVSVKRTGINGIKIHAPRRMEIDTDQIRQILKEFKIMNAEVYIREKISQDDLIETLRGNFLYVPAILVVNKADLGVDYRKTKENGLRNTRTILASATTGMGIEEIKESIFSGLRMIRIYLKEKSGSVDMVQPLILREGSSVRDVCRRISRHMISTFRYANVITTESKVQSRRVGIDHKLKDGDIVNIVTNY